MRVEFTCIICPVSCRLRLSCVGKDIKRIEGALCSKGKRYAEKELSCPTRSLTTTLEVIGGEHRLVSVKSDQELPRQLLMPVMHQLAKLKVQAPIEIGQVLASNILASGVNIVATRMVNKGDSN